MTFSQFFYCLFFLFFVLCFIFYYAIKYKNPYKLVMVFGKKGSGKTTYIAKMAYKYLSKGKTVYSTVPLAIPGLRLFDVNDVGRYSFPPDSVVFIDEVGMIWDNRNYKNFRTDVRDWFKLQRHYKVQVFLFSQTFDIDVKLRNLTDSMYLLKSHFNFLSVCRRISRNITIVNASAESESRIADNLEFVPIWTALFGSKPLIFTFVPHWAPLFDSFSVPDLDLIPSSSYDFPLSVYFRKKNIFFHSASKVFTYFADILSVKQNNNWGFYPR